MDMIVANMSLYGNNLHNVIKELHTKVDNVHTEVRGVRYELSKLDGEQSPILPPPPLPPGIHLPSIRGKANPPYVGKI